MMWVLPCAHACEKNQQLLDQLFELKLKEQQLQDVNKDLRRKIQETSGENVLHMSCQDVGPSGSSGHANEANQKLLHPAVCDPSLPCIYGKELDTSATVVSPRSFY